MISDDFFKKSKRSFSSMGKPVCVLKYSLPPMPLSQYINFGKGLFVEQYLDKVVCPNYNDADVAKEAAAALWGQTS